MGDEPVVGARERQTLADAIRVLAKSRAQARAQTNGESGDEPRRTSPHEREPTQAEEDARALFEDACGELTEALLRASAEPDETTPPAEVPLYFGDDGLGQLLATYCQPPEPEPKDGAGEG